jgi:hypothetical protein
MRSKLGFAGEFDNRCRDRGRESSRRRRGERGRERGRRRRSGGERRRRGRALILARLEAFVRLR